MHKIPFLNYNYVARSRAIGILELDLDLDYLQLQHLRHKRHSHSCSKSNKYTSTTERRHTTGFLLKRSKLPLNSNNSFCRHLSSKQQDVILNVFDRKAKVLQRERAAQGFDGEDVSVYDYIKDEFGYRTADRVWDIKRKFGVVVDLGSGRGHVSKHLSREMIDTVYQCEFSPSFLHQAAVSPEVPTHKMLVDEENLPFKENSIDMFISSLSLHWVNDLPGCFKQVLRALKSDGCFLGSMFGADTLYQLRVSLQLAELEREGGFGPHISPFTTVNDLGNLLSRAGFVLLTIDLDDITMNYPSMFELMFDLKGMAENNCAWRRKPQLHRDSLIAAAAIYKEMYGNEKGIPATFQVVNFIGWKPDPSQPQPAKRGSGQVSLKDIDKLDQITKQIKLMEESTQGEATDSNDTAKKSQELEEELQNLANHYDDTDKNKSKK
ncbi:arginine-hydroxylase NDUFAF5, mitochondrial-like [Biomphalaria glabrata]|uniref:Arginine-hydroxylase NDUFAF5, mitochondrial n=1 Tax=Biomphalaria glabrata TaxID=6526 RepID=A0A9W2ZUC0_BIOGL|nr:arginine-hydroxylase NDUFAF5, mitochondrial-like [Biomphalaria glabrata]